MATEVACATVGEGPTSLEGVVEFLIQRAKKEQRGVGRRREDALPPLFKELDVDERPEAKGGDRISDWSDTGTGGHDWWALQMKDDYCPTSANGSSEYCKLGDVARQHQLNGKTLVAHESICRVVPTTIIANVRGARYIRVPDPRQYDTDLYTPLGFYTHAEQGCVVLRCVLEAFQQANAPLIVEGGNTSTNIYFAFEQAYANTLMPICTGRCGDGLAYPEAYYRTGQFEFNDFSTMKLRMDRSDRPAYNALYRILYFIAGEQPRPPPGAFKVNERDGLYQGWLTATDNAGVIRNESMARRIVKAVCKVGVKDLSTDDAPIFGKICACMDMERDAELKKIDGRMRVECHSAECIGGDDDVYKFAPRIPCVPLKICTQSINVEAEKATLENVTIEGCDFGDDPKPPNTSSPNEPLGKRPLPPSMREPMPDAPAPDAPEPPAASTETSGSVSTMAIAAAAGFLGLIAAIVITVVVVRKRKKSKK